MIRWRGPLLRRWVLFLGGDAVCGVAWCEYSHGFTCLTTRAIDDYILDRITKSKMLVIQTHNNPHTIQN